MTTRRPLSYLGVDSPNPPRVVKATRAPLTTDYTGYVLGDIWINTAASTCYILSSKAAGSATWGIATPGASDVDTINSLPPVAGDIVIAGGTNITDTNAGNTITLDLDDAITLATSVSSPVYTSAGAIDINVAGGSNVTIQLGDAAGANVLEIEDSGSAAVATIDSNGIGTFVGIDGVLGGVTPAAVTATSVTSPLYTATAADAVVKAGGVNDVVLRLGDAAGATYLRVQSSTPADVFTIDSLGALGTLAGLTVAGAFAQTAGTFNVGQDNAGNAINIGGGNVARAISLGATGAHTLSIGSAAAGAITIDTAAGVSIDAATASNFTVTGAGLDLTLSAVGGSVNLAGSQAAADAVNIDASNAAGGIDIDAGTGGIAIDSTGAISIDGAAASNLTVSGAGIDITVSSVAGRAIINGEEAATNAVTINSTAGGIDIDSGALGLTVDSAGALSIDSAGTTNLTATGAFDVTVSSTLGSTIVSGGQAVADAVQITATDAAAGGVAVTSGIGGISLSAVGAAAPVTIDAVGVLELNSSGAAISVGNDANNFAVNVGTAGARTVTVGSATGASSTVVNSGTGAASFGANATDHTTTVGSTTGVSATVLQSGTGDITVTGTVKEITSEFTTRSGDSITFQSDPICMIADGSYGVPTGTTGEVDYLLFHEGVQMEQFIIGAGQTILAPSMDANGLLASLDLTATEGVEYNFDAARTNSRHAFTIGTSPAFFFELRFRINDMDGADPYIFGFRKSEANNATWENYTDYAAIGMNAATSVTQIVIADELNAGGTTLTNSTDLWGGDGTTNTLKVLVSSAGVVTYTINGAAPTATHAFTFDNGDVVVPFIRLEHSASPTAVNLVSMKIGYQA